MEHAVFTNVSGAKCDSGIWDSVQEGPDAGEQVGIGVKNRLRELALEARGSLDAGSHNLLVAF